MRADFDDRCDTFRAIMAEVGNFVVEEYVPLALALVALYPEFDNANTGADDYGGGLGNFLAWGGFPRLTTARWRSRWRCLPQDTASRRPACSRPAPALQMRRVRCVGARRGHHSFALREQFGYSISETGVSGQRHSHRAEARFEDKYSWMKAPRWRVRRPTQSASYSMRLV